MCLCAIADSSWTLAACSERRHCLPRKCWALCGCLRLAFCWGLGMGDKKEVGGRRKVCPIWPHELSVPSHEVYVSVRSQRCCSLGNGFAGTSLLRGSCC